MSNPVPVEIETTPVEAASRERLAEAQRVHKIRRAMTLKAQENVSVIESSWRYGKDEYSAADLAAARVEVERSASLFDAADSELKRAERDLLTDSPEVAQAIAEHAAQSLYVASVRVSNTAPRIDLSNLPEDLPLPCLYVVQKRPTDFSRGGLTGQVELHLVRHAMHRDLDTSRLVAALNGDGWEVEVDSPANVAQGDYATDTATVYVGLGFEAVPVLPSTPEGVGTHAAKLIGEAASKHSERLEVRTSSDGTYSIGDARMSRPTLAYEFETVSVDHEVSKDGTRRSTAVVDLFAWPLKDRSMTEVAHFLTNAVPQSVGRALPYSGRITEAKVIASSPDTRPVEGQFYDRKVIGVRVEVVVTSKVPV